MVKSGDFKTSKSGVVNTNVKKEGEKPDDPRKDHDVEDIKDFIREDSFKVSAINNAPDEVLVVLDIVFFGGLVRLLALFLDIGVHNTRLGGLEVSRLHHGKNFILFLRGGPRAFVEDMSLPPVPVSLRILLVLRSRLGERDS